MVLPVITVAPGLSNFAISVRAGIKDQGQISKLLARLAHLGLIENTQPTRPKGTPNAWRLTHIKPLQSFMGIARAPVPISPGISGASHSLAIYERFRIGALTAPSASYKPSAAVYGKARRWQDVPLIVPSTRHLGRCAS